jgi:hypothetical protein
VSNSHAKLFPIIDVLTHSFHLNRAGIAIIQ